MVSQGSLSAAAGVFLRKLARLLCRRVDVLTFELGMEAVVADEVWTLLLHILENNRAMMLYQHADRIMLCCVYAISKVWSLPWASVAGRACARVPSLFTSFRRCIACDFVRWCGTTFRACASRFPRCHQRFRKHVVGAAAVSPSLQVNGLNLGFGGIIDAYRELGLHARASDHLLKEIQVVEPVGARDVCDRERESEC